MGTQQQLQPPQSPEKRNKLMWRFLFFFTIIIGAIAITAVWILSGLNIIPSTWAIILSAIVAVLDVVIGLWPLAFPPNKTDPPPIIQSEALTPQNIVQVPPSSSTIQEVNASRQSKITEPEQNIEGRGGASNQAISADNNSKISRPKQNMKLT